MLVESYSLRVEASDQFASRDKFLGFVSFLQGIVNDVEGVADKAEVLKLFEAARYAGIAEVCPPAVHIDLLTTQRLSLRRTPFAG